MRKSLLLTSVVMISTPVVVLAQAPPAAGPRTAPERGIPATAKPPLKKAAPAKAAPAANEKPKLEGPMRVVRVRASRPECEPRCPEWISAEGRIVASSARAFKTVLGSLGGRKLPILLTSLGGDVKQAEEIARLIRANRLDVAVAKTRLVPCAPNDKACGKLRAKGVLQGHPVDDLTPCASACPIILAGGVHRIVGPQSFLGVHQIQTYQTRVRITQTYRIETRTSWGVPVSTKKTLVSEKREALRREKQETSPVAYMALHDVFRTMGVDAGRLVAMYEGTPHDKVRWLTRAELLATRIATHTIGIDRVLADDIPEPSRPPAIPRDPAHDGAATPDPLADFRPSTPPQ